MSEQVRVIKEGEFSLENGKKIRVDLQRVRLPCWAPLLNDKGENIGEAWVGTDGYATIRERSNK